MKFNTMYSDTQEILYSPTGDGTKNKYEYKVAKSGTKRLTKTKEKINVYEEIQASNIGLNVYEIIANQLQPGQDIVEYLKDKGNKSYIDLYSLPKTPNEIEETRIKVQTEFNKLPADLKAELNNSMYEYVNSIQNGTIIEKARKVYDKRNTKIIAQKAAEAAKITNQVKTEEKQDV